MFNSIKRFSGFILPLTVVFISLLPILESGLYSDDLSNFQTRHSQRQYHLEDEWIKAGNAIQSWKTAGRYTPVSFYWMELVYAAANTVLKYKLLVFLLNLLPVFTFLILLHLVFPGISRSVWLLCFASVIQFRVGYHDPFTSMNGMYQLLATLILSSLIFWVSWLRNKNPLYLFGSLLLFGVSVLTSEVGLLGLMLAPFIRGERKKNQKEWITLFMGFGSIAFAYLAYTVFLRMHADPNHLYVGLKANLDPVPMSGLFFKQVFSSLPLTNCFQEYALLVVLIHQFTYPVNGLVVLFFLLGVTFCLKEFYAGFSRTGYSDFRFGWLFSLSLMVFPALFILPSVKYQTEVDWGNGYLPYYLQCFGSATLLYMLFHYISVKYEKRGTWFRITAQSLLVLFISVNFIYNRSQIHARNFVSSTPAITLFEEVKAGALDSVKENDILLLANDYYYRDPEGYKKVFFNLTGKKFNVADSPYVPQGDTPAYLLMCKPGKSIEVALFPVNTSGIQWLNPVYTKSIPVPGKVIREEIYPHKFLDDPVTD